MAPGSSQIKFKTPEPGIKVLSVVSPLPRGLPASGFSLQYSPSDTSHSNHTETVLHGSHSLWPTDLPRAPGPRPTHRLCQDSVQASQTHHSCHSPWPSGFTQAPKPHPIPPTLSRFSSGIPISRMPCSLKQSQITLHIHLYQFTLYYNCLSLSQDCKFLEADAVFHLLYLTCLARHLTC